MERLWYLASVIKPKKKTSFGNGSEAGLLLFEGCYCWRSIFLTCR